MTDNNNLYRKVLYELDLPEDMIRVIKEFVGELKMPVRENTQEYYDNYVVKFRNRHKKRSFTF